MFILLRQAKKVEVMVTCGTEQQRLCTSGHSRATGKWIVLDAFLKQVTTI